MLGVGDGVGLLEIPTQVRQGPRGGKYDCMVWYGMVRYSVVWLTAIAMVGCIKAEKIW